MYLLTRVLMVSSLCSLITLPLPGQQFAVHLANVPQMPLDLYVFCCGRRAKVEQGQACIGYPWQSCPCVINLIITSACRPIVDGPRPWIERSQNVATLWYQLELIACADGYTWQITTVAPEMQPSFIPDHAVIVHMPAQYVEKVAMPGEGKDYLTTSSIMKSQALVHLPTIYLKNMAADMIQLLREDLDKAHLCFEFDMVHERVNQEHKQVGSAVLTSYAGFSGTSGRVI